jgi:signal recognition particle GTPase
MDVMTDKELDSPDTINGPIRERISIASSKTVDEVGRMIFAFKNTAVLHAWLQLK